MPKFIPLRHRPVLPHDPVTSGRGFHDFVHVAWYVYWRWVETAARRYNCTLSEGRAVVHKRGSLPPRQKDGPPFWNTDDYLVVFMLQFENWQQKGYDLESLYRRDRHRSRSVGLRQLGVTRTINLDLYLLMLCRLEREDLICHLVVDGRWDLVETLLDDPIYGADAKFELQSRQWSEVFHQAEIERRAAFPENVKKIDAILASLGPSNYSVHYPYSNHHHSVPNCLCVLADGGPVFRLEVLDPPTVTRFRLAELMPPWWSLFTRIGESPAPGEGEYDFPFRDFNFHEGDVFDLNHLLEVLRVGAEQISTRSERKYGI